MKSKMYAIYVLCMVAMIGCERGDIEPPSRVVSNHQENTGENQVIEDSAVSQPLGQICFVSDDYMDDIGPKIYVAYSDGSELRELSSLSEAQLSTIKEIVWKPDASFIAIIAERGGATNIFLVQSNTGYCTAITNDDYYKRDLSWSPDGTHLAYTQCGNSSSTFSNARDIVVIDILSGELEQLTHTGVSQKPRWSEDGQIVYYSDESWANIRAISLDGIEVTLDQSQIDSTLFEENGYGLDYRECTETWRAAVENRLSTPHWDCEQTYLDSPPIYCGAITVTPDSSYVVVDVSIELNEKYFALVDPQTFECTILGPKQTGQPIARFVPDKVYWISQNEFIYKHYYSYGDSGIATFNIQTGVGAWIISNSSQEEPYEVQSWDYLKLQ